MLKNVKCARCVRCGKEYEAVPNLTNCSCGGILDIVYDYDYIKAHLTKETLKNRVNPTMWRYRELLPVEETTPDTPLRVVRRAEAGGNAGPWPSVGQGRRHQPDRLSEGPRLRHGRRQGA